MELAQLYRDWRRCITYLSRLSLCMCYSYCSGSISSFSCAWTRVRLRIRIYNGPRLIAYTLANRWPFFMFFFPIVVRIFAYNHTCTRCKQKVIVISVFQSLAQGRFSEPERQGCPTAPCRVPVPLHSGPECDVPAIELDHCVWQPSGWRYSTRHVSTQQQLHL